MITNRPNGILYTGVTADLAHRITAHRQGHGSEFARRHRLKRLVYVE